MDHFRTVGNNDQPYLQLISISLGKYRFKISSSEIG